MRARSFPLLSALIIVALSGPTRAAQTQHELLSDIDALCRCTGLQRKSGIKSRHGDLVEVFLAADGVTQKYWIELTDGYPSAFGPDNYRVRWQLPRVKDPDRTRFCIDRVKRLDKSQFSWGHFGKPDVVVDSPWGFRVRYDSAPEKKGEITFSVAGNAYFLMTPKGTVCGVWFGE